MDHQAEYRCVATFGRLQEAELARGLLASEGIPAVLADAHVAALGLGPAVSPVRLLVPGHDEALARALLEAPPLPDLAWSSGA